jgi:glycine/D-amino acid oxidase-like deaminating enzyme
LRDKDRWLPARSDTHYERGSITKQFTAAAILQLQDAGKLKIDDKVSVYLSDVPHGGEVTLRQLLTHTSGIADYFGLLSDEEFTKPTSFTGLMKLVADKPLDFAPGSRASYSNTGYMILGRIIEVTSHESYHEYRRKHLLQPAGMKDAYTVLDETSLPTMAKGYRRVHGKLEPGLTIHDCQELSGDEARALEPALGPGVCRAVFTPQWSHVSDPRRILEALREHLRSRGVGFNRNEVRDIRTAAAAPLALDLVSGPELLVDVAVIAAGVWSARLVRRCADRVLLESERGYNATLAESGVEVGRQLIFAERKFVATPLSCGLRIGGAAEFGGLAAVANYQRSQALLTLARRYLPGLRTEGASFWAGHRPATPDSLPVIGSSQRRPGVFYAFGHGHLGLTQAATTGRLIAEAVLGRQSSIDLTPYAIERFG